MSGQFYFCTNYESMEEMCSVLGINEFSVIRDRAEVDNSYIAICFKDKDPLALAYHYYGFTPQI
jgi:hypothetical protein